MRAYVPIFLLCLMAVLPAAYALETCEDLVLFEGESVTAKFNDLVLTSKDRVFWKGEPVHLVRKSGRPIRHRQSLTAILHVFAKRPYTKLTYEQIYRLAYGTRPNGKGESYIYSQMAVLRHSFENTDENFAALKTVWRGGFVWNDGRQETRGYAGVPEIQVSETKILWRDQLVDLTWSQRDMVIFLLENRGAPVSNLDLFNSGRAQKVSTFEKNEYDALKANLYSIRKAFRDVDPDFDRIEINVNGDRFWELIVYKDDLRHP